MSREVDFFIRAAFERFEERSPEDRIQLIAGLKELCPDRADLAADTIVAIREAEQRQLDLLRLIDPED